jgi:spore maturation protein CgeB
MVEEKGFPEVGHFEEKKDLQKFYKHLTDEQLVEWLEIDGLEFNSSDSPQINRMRMCMAILYNHFPKAPSTKKTSKYADYTNEQLVEMALKNDVAFEICEDERILRMRAIMALRASNIIE